MEPIDPHEASGALTEDVPSEQDVVLLPRHDALSAYFRRHARTFSYASRWYPKDKRRLVRGAYAFCRVTDDLVDESPEMGPSVLHARLDAWTALTHEAFANGQSGIPWLDEVMGTSARSGTPFELIEALINGVRMDITPIRLASMDALRDYSYKVASVVGIWLCYLFDVRSAVLHERAETLGHAMQLTNILRDVGEDLRRDRIYLPADLMRAHGIDIADLRAMAAGRPIDAPYRTLIEGLIERAEADYERAWEGIVALPRGFARAVAVASEVYRGIHTTLRRNGYDHFRRRAFTTRFQKIQLSTRALWRLRRSSGSSL